ncbi:MAG TPA: ABC transporter permease [Haliscomenobacter sp.]|uniref:ABC transporter permease n=1 Tax=Haliscomenobacter sp. TaxID=2717303 RepID=UPI002C9A8CB1|nr:ABC transporter permease [Haliscomenobacter sp.]HOY19578.1 ABC transporter permease [Haliscomenobacter sp.]HPH18183.1 ABC transporter permease [Haliscomenobacter sp.]
MSKKQVTAGYWANVWQRFRSRSAGRLALRSLGVFVLIAFLAPFIANERPLYAKLEGRAYFPLLQGLLVDMGWSTWDTKLLPAEDWLDKSYDKVWYTFIPYSPASIDHRNLNARGPFQKQRVESWRFRHWLGTDKTGRDVAAGMLHGTRMALWVGLVAIGVALFFGLSLGGLAGYFGDQGLVLRKSTLAIWALCLPLGLYYVVYLPGMSSDASWISQVLAILAYLSAPLILAMLLSRVFKRILPKSGQITLPLDTLLMRLLEIVDAIPATILVLALIATMEQPDTTYMMVVVGVVSSASVARFVRAEFLRVRKQTYMEAGRALGFGHFRLIFRHALPNAVGPLLVLLSFSMAGAILTESSLSLLGIGAADRVTWGSILGGLRGQHEIEWWLAFFPGLAIFCTVLTFKYLGEGLSEALGEK